MRHTRLTLLVIEQVEADEVPIAAAPAINTTGTELVRARQIRQVRPAPVDAFAPGSALARLESWFRFGRRAS